MVGIVICLFVECECFALYLTVTGFWGKSPFTFFMTKWCCCFSGLHVNNSPVVKEYIRALEYVY